MGKKFTQDAMIQGLFDLYNSTVAGKVDPKVSNAASGNAREIGRQLSLKLRNAQFHRAAKKNKRK